VAVQCHAANIAIYAAVSRHADADVDQSGVMSRDLPHSLLHLDSDIS